MALRTTSLGVVLLVAASACGPRPEGLTNAAETRPLVPTLRGLVVFDLPADQARPEVRRAWALAEEILGRRLPQLQQGPSSEELAIWSRDTMAPWLETQITAARRLDEALAALEQRDPREGLFAAVVHGVVYDEILSQILATPLPTNIADDGELAAVYHGALADSTAPLAAQARRGFELCVERAPTAPVALQDWGAQCGGRLRTLPTTTGIRPPQPPLPPECEGGQSWSTVRAPPPDRDRPMEIAVLAAHGLPGEPAARRRIEGAVRERLDGLLDAPLVPHAEVEAAHRLNAERRLGAEGPQCAAPPAVERILAIAHPNLVVARVDHFTVARVVGEEASEGPDSYLEVVFSRPGALGDREGLPAQLSVGVEASQPSEGDLLAAVARLGTPEAMGFSGMLGMLRGGGGFGGLYRVLAAEDQDPLLNVGATLREDEVEAAIAACVGEPTPDLGPQVMSLRVRLVVSRTGEVESASAETITAPAGRSDEIEACVTRALEASRWTCPSTIEPATVEAVICAEAR